MKPQSCISHPSSLQVKMTRMMKMRMMMVVNTSLCCSLPLGDKTVPDPKAKPSAPMVPPKKPLAPPGKGRPGSLPPKRPDKPLAPSPGAKSVLPL